MKQLPSTLTHTDPGSPLLAFEADAKLLAALANSKRLEIIHLLGDQTLRATEIYEMLDLPQANSSQHLAVLRAAGVITLKKRGRERVYRLSDTRLLQIVTLVRLLHAADQELPPTAALKNLVPLTTDPVCKMKLSVPLASFSSQHNGKEYYFCASGCLKKFQQNPAKYDNHSL